MTVARPPIQNLLDANGYLEDPQQWDADVAAMMAARIGIEPLGAIHWRILQHLRELYLCRDDPLMTRRIQREVELDLSCITTLFGGIAEARKVAGLPDPSRQLPDCPENAEADDAVGAGPPVARAAGGSLRSRLS